MFVCGRRPGGARAPLPLERFQFCIVERVCAQELAKLALEWGFPSRTCRCQRWCEAWLSYLPLSLNLGQEGGEAIQAAHMRHRSNRPDHRPVVILNGNRDLSEGFSLADSTAEPRLKGDFHLDASKFLVEGAVAPLLQLRFLFRDTFWSLFRVRSFFFLFCTLCRMLNGPFPIATDHIAKDSIIGIRMVRTPQCP
jgi:hypothetical protein